MHSCFYSVPHLMMYEILGLLVLLLFSIFRSDVNLSTLGSIEETSKRFIIALSTLFTIYVAQGESLAETTAAAEGNDKHFSSSLADARKKRQRDGTSVEPL